MASFDFISGEDFRSSLEADYTELNSAIRNKEWKAAHVLAGSIIEAILIDYLVASDYQKRTSSDPLKMTLAQAISACKQEQILSERTEHLSHVIRSYRNLIHPGRSIRLGEIANENGAKIAQILVEIIVEEISALKKKNYGYTAEQILTKLENDSSAIAIIAHLLKETNEQEKGRLLLKLIPERYFELLVKNEAGGEEENTLSAFITCYRLFFDSASELIKEKVTREFIRIIKEESSDIAWRYAFFRGVDLQHFCQEDALLVKQHFLSALKAPITDAFFQAMEGIGSFLTEKDSISLISLFIKTIAYYDYDINGVKLSDIAKQRFSEEYENMDINVKKQIKILLEHNYTLNKISGKNSVIIAYKMLLFEIDPLFEIKDSFDGFISEDMTSEDNFENTGPEDTASELPF